MTKLYGILRFLVLIFGAGSAAGRLLECFIVFDRAQLGEAYWQGGGEAPQITSS